MSDIFKPENDKHVLDALRWAATGNVKVLEVRGHGSKRGLGRAQNADNVLDLSGLSGITLYEPEELVMTARAGTPIAEVQAALDDANQMLAFEPWSPKGLYGSDGGTVGGVFASAVTGPRRPLVGSARDHMLGFHAVSGRGEMFKSGGRVVKNVTGFDLTKLMAGSMGTLAVMTDVSFKVLPKAEKSRTVLLFGATDPGQAMRAAQNSPYEVSGVAHLPQSVAARSGVSYVSGAGASVTAVRVEGPGPSVEVRCKALRELLSPYGAIEELHTANTASLWSEIRDVSFFADDRQLWRLSVAPTDGPAIVAQLPGEHFFDWAGGLLWLAIDATDTANADQVRGALINGGHATLMRASEDVRARVPVFQPQADGVAQLMKRVRAGFDPHNILNPGRM
ncbi:glycolate oxidase subunit GlcE [Magnetovibrio sp.]|uniref:glycolate oxidase subunit GlcE n=1 Tax=Magnetovibrio sp. TaxID=2024836 RepID=UPI002F9377B9